MRIVLPILLAMLLPLAGCVPPAPPPASAYHDAQQFAPVALQFAPGSDDASPLDAARLRTLRFYLPATALPELVIAGPRSLRRAQTVRRLLERPIAVLPVADTEIRPDAAVLVIPVQGGVVADACLGPGQPVLGDIWPGDDARRVRMLPAGCAVETALQNQVAAHAGTADLLRGRPLPPGAATPFADVIERYYRRNDPSPRQGQQSGGGNSNSGREGGAAPAGASAGPQPGPGPESEGTNPLIGPLPRAQSQSLPGPASRSQQPWSPSQ